MPFVLIFVGLLLVIAGVRQQEGQLLSLFQADFTGNGSLSGSYFGWLIAIGVLGGLGYIKAIRPLANAFMALVILILFLSNKGFFSQFNQAISQAASTPPASTTSTSTSNTTASTGQSSSNPLSSIMSLFGGGASGANSAASAVDAGADSSDDLGALSDLSSLA
jgi:predicted lipid-binding transport protein (Tim44 family)